MSSGVWFASESGGVGLWALSESTGGTDWEFTTPLDVGTLAGTLSISGDLQFSSVLDLATTAIALTGSLSVSGDIQSVTAWDVSASPLSLSGALSVSGDLQYSSVAYTSSTVLYLPVRMASGLWSTSGVAASSDLTNLQSWLPPQRQPVAYQQGGQWFCDPTWYRFFQFVAEIKLGGRSGPTLPDVVTAITDTQTTAATATASVVTLQQQTSANAEALAATVQVAQNNSLAGAGQIPRVEL